MKTKHVKMKSKRMSSVLKKRGIQMKGEWKAVELDPSVFAEDGLESLVCFEELTSYNLVDPEKVAAKAEKGKKKGEEKKKPKKRKATEEEQSGECPAVESKDDDDASQPAKKKPKKKKKNKKKSTQQDAQPESSTAEVTENIEDIEKEGMGNEKEKEEEKGTQNINKKSNKNKKKKQQLEDATKKTLNTETSPEVQGPDEEKSLQDKKAKPTKKQVKNWTNAARAGSCDKNTDVSAWKNLFVPSPVLKALSSLGFGSPTPIQALALPPAIRDRLDVLGAAETGSGKTLAFGIPMIHTILEYKKHTPLDDQGEAVKQVQSLYLPSLGESENEDESTIDDESTQGLEDEDAELEDDIEDGKEQDDSDLDEGNSEDDEHGDEEGDDDTRLGCVQVIKNVDIDCDPAADKKPPGGHNQPLLGLVLTPTRELAVQVKHHIDAVAKFTDIKTAIVVGGMAPEKQRRMLKRRPEIVIATPGRLWDLISEKHPHLQNLKQLKCLVIDEADRMVERGHFAELENLLEMLNTVNFNPTRQTFVFSATLTMAHSMPTRFLQKKKKNLDQRNKLDILMEKVGIKTKPKIIDLTRKEATVETLMETRIHCQKEEKDFYLYYFLLQYPGRTMVFANSIDCIKRLNSLLVILDCTPLPLHANMHQKQRLKNLERFAERESCVLLTTDVAARGLDIPNVQHVIHYQVPRTSETYVHRSGRTARATKEGLSLLLIGPDDMLNFRKIYSTLGKDEDLPMFPIESKCMEAIKERVNLARGIEKIEFHNCREKQHNSWFKQAAEALEVDLDDDLLLGGRKDEEDDREQQRMVKGMKKQLKQLISQPVFKNVLKTKYPTQMGKLTLPHLPRAEMESALNQVSIQRNKKMLKKSVQPRKKMMKKVKQQQQQQ